MLRLSLIALFAMSMATLTVAASHMPTPAHDQGAATVIAQLG